MGKNNRGERIKIQKFTVFIVLLIFGVWLRIYFAHMAVHPGISDDAGYLNVANNLYDGKGFTEDYIFIYGDNPPQFLTHPSNSIWMPMASIIIYLFLLLFGKTLFASLIASVVAGFFLSILTFLMIKELTPNRFLQFSGFLMTFFLPSLFRESLIPSSRIFYAVFILWAFYWIMIGFKRNPVYIILTGVPAALAYLTRNDGILIIPAIFLVALIYRKKKAWRNVFWCLLIFIILITPWLIRNQLSFGSFFTFSFKKILFLQSPEDIFSFSKTITFGTFGNWGILNILMSKLNMIYLFCNLTIQESNVFIAILCAAGSFIMLKERSIKIELAGSLFFINLFILSICFLFTFQGINGTIGNSIIALLPFFIIISIISIERIIPNPLPQKTIIICAISVFIYLSFGLVSFTISQNTMLNDKYMRVKQFLKHSDKNEPVIMTRFPIDLNYSTGYKTIMIPNEEQKVILTVARKYKSEYILMPAPRSALQNIDSSDNFVLKYSDPLSELKLYKINLDTVDAQDNP